MGTKLLERRQRGIEVTPAGEALKQDAREIVKSTEKIYEDLNLVDTDRPQGRVRVIAAMSMLNRRTLVDVRRFLKEFPRIDVNLAEKIAMEVIRSVEGGYVDVGICWQGKQTQGLDCIPYEMDLH